jgi:hypothetical protein
MSTYNEEDIIEETVSNLINQGVDVYIIDNNSTDNTLDRIRKFVGNGVIKIENVRYLESGKEIYNWTAILEKKAEISRQLDYEWFIHTDADEIRNSPWPDINLKDGIKIVDELGYNLINFKLFDFKLTTSTPSHGSAEERFAFFSETQACNAQQVKAWKRSQEIDLVTHGGHLALVKNPKLFPIRFILKHYPVRSIEQGTKKILAERITRYSKKEKAKDWHVQYDHHSREAAKLAEELVNDEQYLEKFCQKKAFLNLTIECARAFALLNDINTADINKFEKEDYGPLPVTPNVTQAVLSILQKVSGDINNCREVDPNIPNDVMFAVSRLIKKKALGEFLSGKTGFLEKLFSDSKKSLEANQNESA